MTKKKKAPAPAAPTKRPPTCLKCGRPFDGFADADAEICPHCGEPIKKK